MILLQSVPKEVSRRMVPAETRLSLIRDRKARTNLKNDNKSNDSYVDQDIGRIYHLLWVYYVPLDYPMRLIIIIPIFTMEETEDSDVT